MSSIQPRITPPTDCTEWSCALAFRVWTKEPAYAEDPLPWKCAAQFRFLGECLDYIASLQDKGCDCVYQSPAHTRPVRATDSRLVFNSDTVRLARADRERIDHECGNIYAAVFDLLDAEYGGKVAGELATIAERAARNRLSLEEALEIA